MSDFKYYRPNNFTPIVKNLIIINVLVWLAQQMLDKQYGLTAKIALYPIMPAALRDIVERSPGFTDYYGFHPFQIATHMFAHGPLFHILFNMFALWMFGKILENVWGPKRFLLFYLACGVGAAACHPPRRPWNTTTRRSHPGGRFDRCAWHNPWRRWFRRHRVWKGRVLMKTGYVTQSRTYTAN